jgi:tetratricopeptide (TPR) repeat protein
MLRIQAYSYYEAKDNERGLQIMNHLFRIVPIEKRIDKDFEFYGKMLIATNQDSLGIEQLQKAFALDPSRVDLLSEMATSWFKLKQYGNSINLLQQKISQGKDVKVADYYNLGRSYYYNNQFPSADSSFMKVNELSPKYASGWLWRADANSHIDSTSEAGLAKPFYEKYVELAEADSLNTVKYQSGLIKAYGYLAYYYILKKDNANALMYLKKKLQLPLEPEEKKNVSDAIDQLEGRKPKGK